MAIRRCPYCKAIIDEGSEYCSNCGTQLLFPEDENINEEVPGEKIVEEEVPEEENNPKKKKSSSKRRKKKGEQKELEEIETEEEVEPVSEEKLAEEVEFEPIEEGTEGKVEEEAAVEIHEIEAKEGGEESEDEDKPAEEENLQPPEQERDEFFVEKQAPAFGTEDLEKVINPEEKEKAEIEKFLKSLKEDRDEWDGEIPPTDELPPWAEKIKDEKPGEMPAVDVGSEEEVREFEEPQEELSKEEELPVGEFPPGEGEEEKEMEEEVLKPMGLTPEDEVPEVEIPEDDVVKEQLEEGVTEEKVHEEETSEEEATMPDTGMGLPEGVQQENLPFADKSSGEFEEKPPPSRLSSWLKSRAFDVLLIAALWIVTLHIASRMLSTNLFRLISVSVFPVIAFYLSLLGVYLFLFFLFLGQTLGDHLFPHEE